MAVDDPFERPTLFSNDWIRGRVPPCVACGALWSAQRRLAAAGLNHSTAAAFGRKILRIFRNAEALGMHGPFGLSDLDRQPDQLRGDELLEFASWARGLVAPPDLTLDIAMLAVAGFCGDPPDGDGEMPVRASCAILLIESGRGDREQDAVIALYRQEHERSKIASRKGAQTRMAPWKTVQDEALRRAREGKFRSVKQAAEALCDDEAFCRRARNVGWVTAEDRYPSIYRFLLEHVPELKKKSTTPRKGR